MRATCPAEHSSRTIHARRWGKRVQCGVTVGASMAQFSTFRWPGIGHPRLVLAWLVWACVVPPAVALTLAGVPARLRELAASGGTAPHAGAIIGIELALALVFFLTALLVTWRRPRDPVALFLALTLTLLGAVETSLTNALILPEHSPVAAYWHWPVLSLRALEMICALTLLYIFPDGRFVPGWTRPLAVAWIGLTIAWLIIPDLPYNTIYGPTWRATPVESLLVGVGWFSTGIAALTLRYLRVADPVQRRQTWWAAAGLIAAVLGGIAYYTLQVLEFGLGLHLLRDAYWVARPALQALSMALLPLCLAVAILRYRLFDLEIIVNRVLLHGTLTLFVIGAYIGVVSALGALFHTDDTLLFSLIATGLVAVLFQPLRLWLQRAVDRLIYGSRHEPYTVLASLGQRLEAALVPETVLTTIVETVATTLRLPYVAIAQADPQERGPGVGVILAEYRAPSGVAPQPALPVPHHFPLVHRGQVIGSLLVTPRSGEAGFHADEQRLLSDLARQSSSALQALLLTLALQRSRESIVGAREEERRRIRRDLHDGIGPTLASVAQRIGLAMELLPRDPEHSARLLADLEGQVRSLLADIRQLVYALRPPALDQYGLATAVRIEVERIAGADLTVDIQAPERLPALPAAVETALYRIALEAVTNIARHARARACALEIALEELNDTAVPMRALPWIRLTVEDDGCGIGPDVVAGVGLRSMRERAEEIGGRLEITARPEGGTRIQVLIPRL
jgi:signal transduction histidine kinase